MLAANKPKNNLFLKTYPKIKKSLLNVNLQQCIILSLGAFILLSVLKVSQDRLGKYMERKRIDKEIRGLMGKIETINEAVGAIENEWEEKIKQSNDYQTNIEELRRSAGRKEDIEKLQADKAALDKDIMLQCRQPVQMKKEEMNRLWREIERLSDILKEGMKSVERQLKHYQVEKGKGSSSSSPSQNTL